MSDQLDNFENIHGRISSVRVNQKSTIREGREGDKFFVNAVVSSDKSGRELPMFLKNLYRGLDIDTAFETYRRLKKNGLPVVPTLRIDREARKILMTDVTENGRKKVIDVHNPEYPPGFVNAEELKRTVFDLNNRAFENGVLLNETACAIVVDPKDNIGKIMILDLGEVYIFRSKEDLGDAEDQKDYLNYLKGCADDFIAMCIDHKGKE